MLSYLSLLCFYLLNWQRRLNGVHWTAFDNEVQEKGLKKAAMDRFNSHVRLENQMIEDPLPMKKAFDLFEKLTKNSF